MTRAAALLLAALAVAAAPAQPQPAGPAPAPEPPAWQAPPRIEADGDTLDYEGFLNPEGAQRAIAQLAAGRFRTLRIESSGGEIMSSLRLGAAVHERRMDVVVRNTCLSACANYIFPAGARKRIEPGAIVAWHGDARQPTTLLRIALLQEWEQSLGRHAISAYDRQWIADMQGRIAAQDAYYARIGVRDGIARLGHEVSPVLRGFWALPVPDMASYGLLRIDAPADYATPGYCERVKLAQRVPALECVSLQGLKTRPRVAP